MLLGANNYGGEGVNSFFTDVILKSKKKRGNCFTAMFGGFLGPNFLVLGKQLS